MEQLKLDAFLSYRFLSELNWAPDGKRAAVVVSTCKEEDNTYEYKIWLYENGTFRQLTAMGKERNYMWEDATHILFPAVRNAAEKKRAEAGEQFTVWYRLDVTGGEAQPAFEMPFAASHLEQLGENKWLVSGVIDANHPDYYKMTEEERNAVAKAYADDKDYEVLTEIPFYANGGGFVDKKRSALFLYENGTFTRITEPLSDVESTVVLGDKIYYVAADKIDKASYSDGTLRSYDLKNGETKELTGDEWTIYAIQKLGDQLVADACKKIPYQMSPEGELFTVNTESGELISLVELDSLGNSTGSDCRYGRTRSMQSIGDKLYVTRTVRNACYLYVVNADGSVEQLVDREGAVDDFAVSCDGKILINGMYGTKLEEIYTADGGELKQVSDFNTDVLKDVYTADYQKLTITSQGIDIDGWVLLPKDYDEKKTYPAILDIHGGPRTVYGEIFYHEMQLWANMGYFVFFCNPTGGSGRGLEFADICGKYGTIDYENIMDFTDAVLEKYPQIDPKRVGCTGGSYGGFMSNWILGHTDRFAAIATQRSISNWISFYGVSDIGFNFCKSQMGADVYSEEGIQKMWWHSPLRYAKNMKTPTLFIHSDEDYRCPMEQGLQLFTVLKEQGVPARMCYFHGENHELSRSGKPKHRVRRLTEITNWLVKYTTEA